MAKKQEIKKEAPKKEAPKKAEPKKATPKVNFDDKQEVVVEIKGKQKTVGGFNAKVLIKKGAAKFIKIAD